MQAAQRPPLVHGRPQVYAAQTRLRWHAAQRSSSGSSRLAISNPLAAAATQTPATVITDELCARLVNYKKQVPLEGGVLTIRPLHIDLLQPCAEILTDAFVDTAASKLAAYRRFLQRQISSYLIQQRSYSPKTLVLTATWAPGADAHSNNGFDSNVDSDSNTEAGPGPGSQAALLMGTAEISFDAVTRAKYFTLNPPATAAYLSNMAVAPQHRRKGVALVLMNAIEELCEMVGQPDIYLHLRFQDAPAGQLYRKAGFTAAKEDVWLVLLLGMDRRYLMHKRLPSSKL